MTEKQSTETGFIVIGRLKIDLPGHCTWLDNQPLLLCPLEFKVLVYLAQHTGRVVTANELLREIWGCSLKRGGTKNMVYCRINGLRRAFRACGATPGHYLSTKVGHGWQMLPHPTARSCKAKGNDGGQKL
jgi:DNA-binding response OmpR family regulator